VSQEHPPLTAGIAKFVVEQSLGADTDELLERATRALIDTVGVTIAGRSEEGVLALMRALRGEAAAGRSTLLVNGERTSEMHAALVNGTASHALDYDDVLDVLYGHPSAAMFPALLAVAEREGASGQALLEAYVVGFQVIVAVAAGLPIRRHYSHGWHSTATVGVLGATAGLCRLLGLQELEVRRALGLAASMASGSRQNFGTMTKPLHPGLAGRSAVTAARLAQEGFTADASQLEEKLGYFAMFGFDPDLDAVLTTLHGPWALSSLGLNVKKYPCCYNTHRTADATLELVSQVGTPADVERIRLTMEPGGFDPLIHHRPDTGLEAKFSAEYVIAAGLLDDRIGLETFTDAAVQRPEAQELLRKVEVAESATPPWGEPRWEHAYATLEIERGGETLRRRVDVPRGDARAPLSDAEVDAKFHDCLSYSASDSSPDALLDELRRVRDVRRLDGFDALNSQSLTAR